METNMELVKEAARTLLYVDVHLTEFSPLIIQHPFSTSGHVGIRDNGKIRLLNIVECEEDLKLWRKYISDLIDKAESARDLYIMFATPYALTFLKFAKPYLSKKDMSEILASAWTTSENPCRDPNVSKLELLAMFLTADPVALMSKEELEEYHQLSDTVTVYRGVTSHAEDTSRGLSWTLKYETARWFAQRFGCHGCVYEAQIGKEHIHAYFNGRNESEVIVHPKYLLGLTRHEIKI